MLPIALINCCIMTGEGVYTCRKITKEEAIAELKKRGHVSHIGHTATADLLKDLFGVPVAYCRLPFRQTPEQDAIAIQLDQRLEEGRILSSEELAEMKYTLYYISMEKGEIHKRVKAD